jgi:acyl-CoA synthetase (AMP-forming)/AMP-acid ligase II
MKSIVDYLPFQAQQNRDKVFITEGKFSYTYLDIYTKVGQLAHILAQKTQQGDRVALIFDSYTEHTISYFACLAVGVIPIQLYQGKPFIEFAVSLTQINLILTKPNIERAKNLVLNEAKIVTPEICFLPDFSAEMPFLWAETRRNIASIMFTSGTTGYPKGVMLSQENILEMGKRNILFGNIKEDNKELIMFPPVITSGMGSLCATLIIGGSLVFYNDLIKVTAINMEEKDREIAEIIEILDKQAITGFFASPNVLTKLFTDYPNELAALSKNLRHILSSYIPIPQATLKKMLAILPNTAICSYYGMTEASRSVVNYFHLYPEKSAYAGQAVGDEKIMIHEPDINGIGEVCFKGANVMLGYWQDEATTKLSIDSEGWLHTGDLGIIENGWVMLKGRLKEQIAVEGWKCQPREVEEILNQHPFVKESVVVAVSDEVRYQVVGAVVVTNQAIANPRIFIEELHNLCKINLVEYKTPKYLSIIDKIPLDNTGKIQREKIRQMLINKS